MGKITRATLNAISIFWKGCVYKVWYDAKLCLVVFMFFFVFVVGEINFCGAWVFFCSRW